jgi:hypothetical protein
VSWREATRNLCGGRALVQACGSGPVVTTNRLPAAAGQPWSRHGARPSGVCCSVLRPVGSGTPRHSDICCSHQSGTEVHCAFCKFKSSTLFIGGNMGRGSDAVLPLTCGPGVPQAHTSVAHRNSAREYAGIKYPTLTKIAGDIMAILVTTVPSESVFSTGGRIISPHRSRLAPKTADFAVRMIMFYSCVYQCI